MINKKYIHLLNYFASKNLLTGESKHIYKKPHGEVELYSSKKRNQETLKEMQRKLKERTGILRDYEEGFDKFIKTKSTVDIKGRTSAKAVILNLLKKNFSTLPRHVKKSRAFAKFATTLVKDLGHIFEKNAKEIRDNMPCKITIEKGGEISFHNKEGFNLNIDIRKSSNSLQILNSLRSAVKSLRDKISKKKEVVVKRTIAKKAVVKKAVKKMLEENPRKATDKLIAKNQYLVKYGSGYKVQFLTPKRKIDRKAEKAIQIHDLFDLSKLEGGNVHIRFYVTGVSRGGRKFAHWAVYHPGAKTFIIEGTTKRVRIYHNTIIKDITYKAGEYRPEEPKPAPAPVAKIKPPVKPKAEPKEKPEVSLEKLRMREVKANLTDMYYGYVFQNARFNVPENLRDDKHYENQNIWKKVSRYLGPILESAPFNLTSAAQKRIYIQEIVQKDLNTRLYAEDFFKIKLDGKRELYKGGYKKFLKDYYRVEKDMIWNDIDEDDPRDAGEKAIIEQWNQLTGIAFGLSRVFEAFNYLRSPEVYKVHKETRVDIYRPLLLGMDTVKEPRGTKYHNLESLLHKKEQAPKSLNIGVTDLMLAKIKEQFYKFEIPDFHPGDLLRSKGGLKLLFMAFGFKKLLAEKCLKKVDGNKLVLVKLPKYGWLEALATIQQTKAKLWDHSKDDFEKWEKVRASLSRAHKARLFIRAIFTPTGSVVKENFNWWQGMWHGRSIWNKDREISMAHLGTVTINPKHFEKYMAQDRGYLDMIEKTSKRIEGTSIYQPQASEVLKKTNDYIEYGLTSVLMNATDANFHKVVPKLVKELGIEGKIGMDMNSLLNKNKIEILDILYKALKLNNIDPGQLKGKKALIKLIRVGFILGRRIETSKKWAEVMNKNLSTKPLYRKIQLDALKKGCPVYKLKEIEQRVHLAIIGLASGQVPHYVRETKFGGGVTASIRLFNIGGNTMHLTLGVFGKQGKGIQEQLIPFVSIGAMIRAGKKVKLRFALGTTAGFVGGGMAIEVPITDEWDFYIAASGGVDYKRQRAGVALGVGGRWDRERATKLQLERDLALRKIKDIDKAIEAGNIDTAAQLILKNPTFGKFMKRIHAKGILDNAGLVDLYLQAKKDWKNIARRNLKVPWILGFGVGAFAGVDLKSGQVVSFGAGGYITFKIPGTEITYVVRHEHPQYSGYMQKRAAQVELRKKLRKEGAKNFRIAPYVIKASSGILYFDSHLGRSGVAKPKGSPEAPAVAQKTGEKTAAFNNTFELVKKTFAKLDIHVEKVKDPKNPKGFLLALTPLQTQGSNVEILIDPVMKAKGLILDKANNRFLIAASVAKDLNLYVTRSTYRYPFRRQGTMNLHVIAFKSNPDTDNIAIRQASPWSLYKFRGEKYGRVKNEAVGRRHYNVKLVNGRPVITRKPSNVMTFAEYKNSKRSFETFTDQKAEYTKEQGKEMSSKLFEAMHYKEVEPIRTDQAKLKEFGKWLYALRTFRVGFNVGVGKLKTPGQEDKFKTKWFGKIAARYEEFVKKHPKLKLEKLVLNEQEKNLMYAYLLDRSFTELLSKKRKNYPNVITRRLEIRNKLFKRYMNRYLTKFIKNNPKQWEEIQNNYPGASKTGILNYLVLCMPQNFKQLQQFLASGKGKVLAGGLKYGSYTHRYGKLEAMPTAFGADAPQFSNILKMIRPTRLNVNSPNPQERAAANVVLRMMSPLPVKNIDKPNGKANFLKSELSQLLLSMYDKKTGISPFIQILGTNKFKGLTSIISKLDKPKELAAALKKHSEVFEDFKTIVLGIRDAQITGKSTFVFKDKYIFHVARTEIYAGPYLKCGNGTVAVNQKIGISIKGVKRGRIYGARTDLNIRAGATETKAYGKFTIGIYTGMKFKKKKSTPPSRHEEPPKDVTPTRHTPPAANQPAPTSGTPPVSEGPSDSI